MFVMEARRLVFLAIVMVAYLCVGAAIFNALEAKAERDRKTELEERIYEFLEKYPNVNYTELVQLLRKASLDNELTFYIINNKTHLDRWDFSGSFGFAISVVTTIGFGNLAPHTMEGKVLCVVYALVGIPLMLLLLAGIGEKLMVLFKRINRLNICSTKPQANRVLNTLLVVLLGLLVGFIAPATMFHLIEDWHFLEALYFCFTTLSTIGFGDYIIGIHEQRISEGVLHETYEVVAYVWILFGLAYVSLVIKFISDALISKAETVKQKTVRRLGESRLFRSLSGTTLTEIQTVEEKPPPLYDTEIHRFNGELRKASSVVRTRPRSISCSARFADHPSDTETTSTGVELISVNYI